MARPALGEEKRTSEREENGERDLHEKRTDERGRNLHEKITKERGAGGEENSFWRNNDNGRNFRKRLKERF